MRMKKFRVILASCAALLLLAAAPVTQSRPGSFRQERPTHCGNSNAVLDGLAQKTPAEELLIVVARLGDGETRPDLNQRRLHNVRTYLTEFLPAGAGRRQPQTILLTQGEKVSGLGRVEFYVRGELIHRLPLKQNADLVVGTCYPEQPPCTLQSDQNFYPCRAGRRLRHKARGRLK